MAVIIRSFRLFLLFLVMIQALPQEKVDDAFDENPQYPSIEQLNHKVLTQQNIKYFMCPMNFDYLHPFTTWLIIGGCQILGSVASKFNKYASGSLVSTVHLNSGAYFNAD